ncbi:UNKNOWN [Stylonychia lemnae]|uniref:Uncharacterized protein n=1 Tax=Stylonychia lemnae TaxID=5949 RepID=A0A077ZWB0_STYLE|nr:UNKNOWN [Stylonychia lemnae]|eukprot:CDW74159.1 UNKNOWN [Stylonychia lemnae]
MELDEQLKQGKLSSKNLFQDKKDMKEGKKARTKTLVKPIIEKLEFESNEHKRDQLARKKKTQAITKINIHYTPANPKEILVLNSNQPIKPKSRVKTEYSAQALKKEQESKIRSQQFSKELDKILSSDAFFNRSKVQKSEPVNCIIELSQLSYAKMTQKTKEFISANQNSKLNSSIEQLSGSKTPRKGQKQKKDSTENFLKSKCKKSSSPVHKSIDTLNQKQIKSKRVEDTPISKRKAKEAKKKQQQSHFQHQYHTQKQSQQDNSIVCTISDEVKVSAETYQSRGHDYVTFGEPSSLDQVDVSVAEPQAKSRKAKTKKTLKVNSQLLENDVIKEISSENLFNQLAKSNNELSSFSQELMNDFHRIIQNGREDFINRKRVQQNDSPYRVIEEQSIQLPRILSIIRIYFSLTKRRLRVRVQVEDSNSEIGYIFTNIDLTELNKESPVLFVEYIQRLFNKKQQEDQSSTASFQS